MNLPEEYRDAFLCGDCLELLPKVPGESVDLILTDPPYGIDYQSNRPAKREKMAKMAGDKNLSWLPEFVREAYRVLKPDRHVYCFTRWDMYPVFWKAFGQKFTIKNCLIWMKANHGSGDLSGDYAPKYEMILFMEKGRRRLLGKRMSNVLPCENVPVGIRVHPAQKPITLLRTLLEKSTEPGEMVLDPFAGVGSAGLACKWEMGAEQRDYRPRGYLMMEVDARYHRIGMDRIKFGAISISKRVRVFAD